MAETKKVTNKSTNKSTKKKSNKNTNKSGKSGSSKSSSKNKKKQNNSSDDTMKFLLVLVIAGIAIALIFLSQKDNPANEITGTPTPTVTTAPEPTKMPEPTATTAPTATPTEELEPTVEPDGVLGAKEAYEVLCAYSKEALHIAKEVKEYDVEYDEQLTLINGVDCYRFNLSEFSNGKVRNRGEFFISVDGTKCYYINSETNEFIQAEK